MSIDLQGFKPGVDGAKMMRAGYQERATAGM